MAKRVEDFHDHNILSYVYDTKPHKSYEYDMKKEANIKKIMEVFPAKDKIAQYHENKFGKMGKEAFNPTDGPTAS